MRVTQFSPARISNRWLAGNAKGIDLSRGAWSKPPVSRASKVWGFGIDGDRSETAAVPESRVDHPPGGGDPLGEFGGLLGLNSIRLPAFSRNPQKSDNVALNCHINPVTGAHTLVGKWE